MRWKTYNRLDEKAQAYEQLADAQLWFRLRRILRPNESVSDMISGGLHCCHACAFRSQICVYPAGHSAAPPRLSPARLLAGSSVDQAAQSRGPAKGGLAPAELAASAASVVPARQVYRVWEW